MNPNSLYPGHFKMTPEDANDFFEAGLKHLNSDGFSIDGGHYLHGRVDTFVDQDYVCGMRIIIEFRNDLEQAANSHLDDLFIYRCPSFVRPLWYNEPHAFFKYGGERDMIRRQQFLPWYHGQGWAQEPKDGDWTHS